MSFLTPGDSCLLLTDTECCREHVLQENPGFWHFKRRQRPVANSNSVLSVSEVFPGSPSASTEPRALGPGNTEWQAWFRVQLAPGNMLSNGKVCWWISVLVKPKTSSSRLWALTAATPPPDRPRSESVGTARWLTHRDLCICARAAVVLLRTDANYSFNGPFTTCSNDFVCGVTG